MKVFFRIFFVCFTIYLISIQINCSRGGAFSFVTFTFPVGSQFLNNDWDYLGKVVTTSLESGPVTNRSKKRIEILIIDKDEKKYLDDKYNAICADITAEIKWTVFDKLSITIIEKGNPYANDSYNKTLIRKGPKELFRFTYIFNNTLGKFIKDN